MLLISLIPFYMSDMSNMQFVAQSNLRTFPPPSLALRANGMHAMFADCAGIEIYYGMANFRLAHPSESLYDRHPQHPMPIMVDFLL